MVRSGKRAARRAEVWKTVQEYKSAMGCSKCGYDKHPVALQLHHTTGDKKDNVSDLIRSDYGIKTIWREVMKCTVLCANCHAIESHYLRNSPSVP